MWTQDELNTIRGAIEFLAEGINAHEIALRELQECCDRAAAEMRTAQQLILTPKKASVA